MKNLNFNTQLSRQVSSQQFFFTSSDYTRRTTSIPNQGNKEQRQYIAKQVNDRKIQNNEYKLIPNSQSGCLNGQFKIQNKDMDERESINFIRQKRTIQSSLQHRVHIKNDQKVASNFSMGQQQLQQQLQGLKQINREINNLKNQSIKSQSNFLITKLRQRQNHLKPQLYKHHDNLDDLSQDDIENQLMIPPQMARTDSKLNMLQQKIKEQCRNGEVSILNPTLAFEIMNVAQREEDPEAYEPEIVVQHRKKIQLLQQQQAEMKRRDALFDFDVSIDNLSDISDRYPIVKMLEQINHENQVEQGDQVQICPKQILVNELISEMAKEKKQVMTQNNSFANFFPEKHGFDQHINQESKSSNFRQITSSVVNFKRSLKHNRSTKLGLTINSHNQPIREQTYQRNHTIKILGSVVMTPSNKQIQHITKHRVTNSLKPEQNQQSVVPQGISSTSQFVHMMMMNLQKLQMQGSLGQQGSNSPNQSMVTYPPAFIKSMTSISIQPSSPVATEDQNTFAQLERVSQTHQSRLSRLYCKDRQYVKVSTKQNPSNFLTSEKGAEIRRTISQPIKQKVLKPRKIVGQR